MMSVLKNFFKNILPGLFVATFFFGTVEAKDLPTITWGHDIYTMTISDEDPNVTKKRNYQLLNSGSDAENKMNQQRIADAIAAKLREQASQLPFKIKTSMDANDVNLLNAEIDDSAGETPLALVPIVVLDFSIDKEYVVNNSSLHKYILISAVDIAFCSQDSNGALTILGNIPLHYYTNIPVTNSLDQMTEKNRSELARIYTDFTVDMIRKKLDFTKFRKSINLALKRKDVLGAIETYRVEDVRYTSGKAQTILGHNRLMQRIAGNLFTGEYAAYTGNVVYPMILAGDRYSWTLDAEKSFYITQMATTHSGEKIVRMPAQVDHKIYLDVTGIGQSEIKGKYNSNINGFRSYGLQMKSIVGGKNLEVKNFTEEEYLKDTGTPNRIIKKEDEIYGGLMIGAAIKSAAAQAGKKVKLK